MIRRKYIDGKVLGSVALLALVIGAGVALASWKAHSLEQAAAASSSQPEPMESVVAAVAREREHSRTATAIGTVVALRSITLRNEVPGTVHKVALTPGRIVEAGTVLVALDVSVEQAELEALQAQAQLAGTVLARMERMTQSGAASRMELDNARAERDVAQAQIARLRAIIARKTIRAPFRARVGISDVHEGQYLNEGTQLTTLQGVDEAAYVDFTVAQQVAAGLRKGGQVNVFAANDAQPTTAQVVAIDSRVDPSTRNAVVRAKVAHADLVVAPGASVRVVVPVGLTRKAVAIPASALRKGPGGDHVFVLEQDPKGQLRARERQVKVDALLGDEVIVQEGLAAG
ncbi:MAG TPA: efflux RND transporter periplasmic adaptor subunit, partial [Steroidobacteraceae bacterium]|nr:efflux RND transporter periplasmic adaptor subunit [Steroidobacteraceae bacterium]